MAIEIRDVELDQVGEFVRPIGTAFGFPPNPDAEERLKTIPEFDVRIGAYDGDEVVGAAGSFSFEMTIPGRPVPTAGLTMVAVLPTHRRQGILRRLMRRHLDEARERGQLIAALYASEAVIYGRFGYGIASLQAEIDAGTDRAAFTVPTVVDARARLLDEDEALATFPRVYERVRPAVTGMLSRSEPWWRARRLSDPEWRRRGKGPLQRVLLERDGEAVAYALYRYSPNFEHGIIAGTVDVVEAVAVDDETTRQIWRYLFDLDVTQRVTAALLPVDHPLVLLASEPRRLGFRLGDALWIRIVDVTAALATRVYLGDGEIVFEVQDEFCRWNEGRWRLVDGSVERVDGDADLRLDVAALGSVYLGGFTFAQLARGGRVGELTDGAIARADRLFSTRRAPWCPEIF